MKAPNTLAQKVSERSPESLGVEKDTDRTGLGKEKQTLKPNSSVSVKGKKALARAKAIQDNSSGTTKVAKGKVNPLTHHAKDQLSQSCDGDQQPWGSSELKFTTAPYLDLGFQFEGRDCRESNVSYRRVCDPDPNHGLVQGSLLVNMEEQSLADGDKHNESEPSGPNRVPTRAEDGDSTIFLLEPLGYQANRSSCGFAGEGNGCAADRMDLEGGGDDGAGLQ